MDENSPTPGTSPADSPKADLSHAEVTPATPPITTTSPVEPASATPPPSPPPATPASPPPFSPPPPIIMAPLPSAPRRSGGRVWMIIAIIAIVALGFSMLGNLGQMTKRVVPHSRSVHQVHRDLEEVILERHSSDDKIAVIEIKGVITSAEVDPRSFQMAEYANDKLIREQLKAAGKDSDVKAVILKVDSPGGEVLASDEINKEIVRFQTKTGKPVIASMGTLAASGGYYVSAPCRWIVANDLTITGSIGVIMHGLNYRGLMDKIGLKPEVFKSGKFKDMLSGDKETDPEKISPEQAKDLAEERRMVQELINETFDRFREVVEVGREEAHIKNAEDGKALAKNWREFADGRVFSGKQAYNLGFVDELGSFEKAVERAEKLGNVIGRATLIEYQKPFDIGLLFRLLGQTGSQQQSLKIDIAGAAPKLKAGQLYYITPTALH